MKASEINYRLVRYLINGSEIVLPNYYYSMYEMDVFRVSNAGFVFEYEIKISRSDFFADFKKGLEYSKSKHEQVKNGSICNRFIFVTPKGLIELHEVPEYCGHIEFNEKLFSFEINKVAPLIHNQKIKDSRYKNIAQKASFREFYIREKLMRLKNK